VGIIDCSLILKGLDLKIVSLKESLRPGLLFRCPAGVESCKRRWNDKYYHILIVMGEYILAFHRTRAALTGSGLFLVIPLGVGPSRE
jgi:hypothetical protein